MCVLHGAGNLQANLHLTHGLPRLASSPHLTAHNPHPPCRPEKEEEVGATKGPSLWSAGMWLPRRRELSQECTTSPPGGNSRAEVVMWFDLWGCDHREEKGTELSCPDSPVWCGHRSALLTGVAFCHAWGWMTAQGSLAVPFLGPCEVGAGSDGSGGAHHPASQGSSLAL